MYRNSKEQAKRFATKFNCANENSKVMLECLQAVDIYTLIEAHRDLMVTDAPFFSIREYGDYQFNPTL